MIGTQLIEELVQSVALSHCVKGYRRASLLMLAAPESGKTTIATAADCTHVKAVAIMTGRSIIREINSQPNVEFLLFNDLTVIRALSPSAGMLLITMLNQITQDERGIIGFAGGETTEIKRPAGIIGCLAFSTFADHRSRWKDIGFISRMIPFAYSYDAELVAEIKDAIDTSAHIRRARAGAKMPKAKVQPITVKMTDDLTRAVRRLSDARAIKLKQIGIRLLQNYHVLIRAHAVLMKRAEVTAEDLTFLRAVDAYVSITECMPLKTNGKE